MILSDGEVRAMSALALAHMGDAVYEILARREVCRSGKLTAGERTGRPSGMYPPRRRRAAEKDPPASSGEEAAVYRRGRNAHSHAAPAPRRRPSTTPLPGWRRCSGGSISADKTSGSRRTLCYHFGENNASGRHTADGRRELENSLWGAKIDRISMPEKDVIPVRAFPRAGSRRVLISVRPGGACIFSPGADPGKPAAAADVLHRRCANI